MHVFIIGAGIAGCALAMLLSEQEDFTVTVFEKRRDVTQLSSKNGRTINMLLTPRGVKVIEECGVLDTIVSRFPKIYGRMVHAPNGQSFVPYSIRKSDSWHNISIARNELINLLMQKAMERGVKFYFGYDLSSLQITKDKAACQFVTLTDSVVKLNCDLVIGADGLYSAVRARIPTSVSQYITDYCYKELTIAPTDTGTFVMDPHSIHVFPRGKYFMIALPNEDFTFRCTLVMPSKGAQALSNLKTCAQVREFLAENFPDVPTSSFINLAEFVSSPVNPLWSVMCAEYHLKDRVVLVGDAAHTILPFLGQGMNLALEDVHVLAALLKESKHSGSDLSEALAEFTHQRKPDADAIQTLSEVNFKELSACVQSKSFQLQKKIELALHRLMPNLFAPPPFIAANFFGLSYSSVKERVDYSNWLMNELIFTAKMLGLSFVGKVLLQNWKPSKFLAKL